jgi:hypothetical protein
MILRLTAIFLACIAALILAVGALFYFTGVLVVDVRDKRHDNHVFVPVPMLLVRGVAHFLPSHARVHTPLHLRENRDLVLAASRALQDCPDGEFVRVESPDKNILIRKDGDELILDADTPDQELHIRVPLDATGETLAELTGRQW